MKRAVFLGLLALSAAADASALGVDVKDLRAAAAVVTASIELRDVLPDRFRQTVDQGGVVHLRIHTEVWERRPAWDRLVYPAVVRVFRLARTPSGREFAVYDPEGAVTFQGAAAPNPLPLAIRVGSADRLLSAARYYAKVIATLGTLEREINDAGDAVFGRPEESSGLGAFGRTIFQKVLEISDYMQSVSAQGVSRTIGGGQILKP